MSIGDDALKAVAIAQRLAPQSWKDEYEVIGTTETPDSAGGLTTVDVVIESGLCRRTGRLGGNERVVADKLGFTSPVVLNLPQTTLLTPSHTIVVNGHTFEVGEVQRGDGAFDYQTVAICEEINE